MTRHSHCSAPKLSLHAKPVHGVFCTVRRAWIPSRFTTPIHSLLRPLKREDAISWAKLPTCCGRHLRRDDWPSGISDTHHRRLGQGTCSDSTVQATESGATVLHPVEPTSCRTAAAVVADETRSLQAGVSWPSVRWGHSAGGWFFRPSEGSTTAENGVAVEVDASENQPAGGRPFLSTREGGVGASLDHLS